MATVTGPVQVHNRKLTDGYTTPSKTASNPTGGDSSTPGSWIGNGGKPKTKSPTTHGVDLTYDMYSDAMGTLNQSNTQRRQTYGAFDDMLGNYDYDEAALRAKFDAATKAEYAAKRKANQQAQADFANYLGDVTQSATDINRANLANAVANGYSRGTLAAQQYGAMLGVQEESVAEATALAQEQRQLAYDEAAAYAQNVINAEQTTQDRIKDAATLLSQVYGYDANAIGSALYSAISGAGNVFGVNKTVQADMRNQDIQKSIAGMQNQTDLLGSMMNEGYTFSPGQLANWAQAQGIIDAEGNPIGPVGYNDPRYSWNYNNNSSSGGYGSGSNSPSDGSSLDISGVDPTNLAAYVTNGKWNGDGKRVMEQCQYNLNDPKYNETLRGVLALGGVTAAQENKLVSALNNNTVRLFTKTDGNYVLALDPASTEGLVSRNDRETAAKNKYGTLLDPETLSNWNDTAKLFNYKGVVILDSNGKKHTGNEAAEFYTERIKKYMGDYYFWRGEDGNLWCKNKAYNEKEAVNNTRFTPAGRL